jgi:two-component system sensor histidine kinase UhpB
VVLGLGDERHRTSDRRSFLTTVGILQGILIAGVMTQFIVVTVNTEWYPGLDGIALRAVVNIATVGIGLLIMSTLFAQIASGGPQGILVTILVAVVTAAARSGAQWALSLYPEYSPSILLVETAGAAAMLAGSGLIGLAQLRWAERLRREAAERLRRQVDAERAIELLEHEELRVRQEVSDRLHGHLQGALVMVNYRVRGLAAALAPHDPQAAGNLEDVAREIDALREREVRELSHSLSPQGLELGLAPAIRVLLGRLPPTIATSLTTSPSIQRLDDPVDPALDSAERLLAFRIVEEGVSNAIRHGSASAIEVSLDTVSRGGRSVMVARIAHDGLAPSDESPGQGGIDRLARRAELLGGSVQLRARSLGGELRAEIPLRAPTPS